MAYPYAMEICTVGPIEVTIAMRQLGRKKITLSQIVEKIMTRFDATERWEVPIAELKSSLDDLIVQGDVVRKGNYYYLEHDVFEKMERIKKRYNL